MRIIGGELKGRTLAPAKGVDVRPVTDRVKQVIFDVFLTRISIKNTYVLDAFCGTGSLGLEALSRGATRATFVDDSLKSLDVLQKNIAHLRLERKCEVVKGDAMSFFQRKREGFDIIFADPPYAFERTNEIPSLVFTGKLLSEKGILVIEHDKHLTDWVGLMGTDGVEGEFKISLVKNFGNTIVSFFQYSAK